MAVYPSIGYDRNRSAFDAVSGNQLDRADDGTPRIRSFYADDQFELTIVHPMITLTERDQILAFYAANKGLYVTFNRVSDSEQYNVLITERPRDKHVSGSYWDVTVNMVGTLL